MSRLRIFLLFAALAALATVFAACGSSAAEAPTRTRRRCSKDSTFEGIENADLDLRSKVDVSGDEGGNVDVSLSGPFQSEGKPAPGTGHEAPKRAARSAARTSTSKAAWCWSRNKAYVNYEGDDYEVDPTTFSFVESAIEEAQQKSGAESGTEGSTACQKKPPASSTPATSSKT